MERRRSCDWLRTRRRAERRCDLERAAPLADRINANLPKGQEIGERRAISSIAPPIVDGSGPLLDGGAVRRDRDQRHGVPVNEPFDGRFYGIFNVESDDPSPVMMFRGEVAAKRELERRQALGSDDDDWLDMYHQVFRADVVGVWWNSYEPDPGGL